MSDDQDQQKLTDHLHDDSVQSPARRTFLKATGTFVVSTLASALPLATEVEPDTNQIPLEKLDQAAVWLKSIDFRLVSVRAKRADVTGL